MRVATPDGEVSLKNDFVCAPIGYRPDLAFLNATGIALEPDTLRPRTNPETLESGRAGVYRAGVIVAGMHTNEIFIENGRLHGQLIAEAIAATSPEYSLTRAAVWCIKVLYKSAICMEVVAFGIVHTCVVRAPIVCRRSRLPPLCSV